MTSQAVAESLIDAKRERGLRQTSRTRSTEGTANGFIPLSRLP